MTTTLTCDCESGEWCGSCLPEISRDNEMLIMKDGKVGPAHLKIASSPSYTVAEMEALMREWLNQSDDIGGTEELALAFRLSIFIEWLKRRDREAGR